MSTITNKRTDESYTKDDTYEITIRDRDYGGVRVSFPFATTTVDDMYDLIISEIRRSEGHTHHINRFVFDARLKPYIGQKLTYKVCIYSDISRPTCNVLDDINYYFRKMFSISFEKDIGKELVFDHYGSKLFELKMTYMLDYILP